MSEKWVRRKPHNRRSPLGKIVYVGETWALYTGKSVTSRTRIKGRCPKCNAQIVSRQMPNSGWGHFESGRGLSNVKHPCFDKAKVQSRKDDDRTLELLDFADDDCSRE